MGEAEQREGVCLKLSIFYCIPFSQDKLLLIIKEMPFCPQVSYNYCEALQRGTVFQYNFSSWSHFSGSSVITQIVSTHLPG